MGAEGKWVWRRRLALVVSVAVTCGFAVWAGSSQAAVRSSAPRLVTSAGLDRSARVSWSAPTSDGGTPIDAYRVRVVQTGIDLVVPATVLTAKVRGLVNGHGYTFTVWAHNAVGWSFASVATKLVYVTRPNILFVLTDDQRWDSLPQLPETDARPWRRYTNSLVDEPQCCPSRASTFTGRLPTHTHVDTLANGKNLDAGRTYATMLHNAGYQTIFAGKYLNGYPWGDATYVPPGWDKFFGFVKHLYFNEVIRENNRFVQYGSAPADYSTDVLRDDVIKSAKASSPARPMLVEFAPFAPHRQRDHDPIPAPRDAGSCAGDPFPLPPNFNAHDTVGEPAWMHGELPRSTVQMRTWRKDVCETLKAVDTGLSAILQELTREGRIENTYIVFTSDNGYQFGEHRLFEKGDLYEESVRVPLLVHGPGVIDGTDARLTSNIDLAPTFLEWAGVAKPVGFFDGKSFAPSARGDASQNPTAVLLHGCRTGATKALGGGVCGGYPTNMGMNWGLRTARYKYIRNADGYEQLFDIVADPYEMTNLAPDPAHAAVVKYLRGLMIAKGGGQITPLPAVAPPDVAKDPFA